MKNLLGIIAGCGICSFGLCGPISLYMPNRTVKDQGIALKAWGSGTIAETDEAAYEGTQSVRISTRNYFQGGRMVMSTPVDLAPVYSDKNNLLMIVIKLADSGATMGGGMAPGRGGLGPGRTGGGVGAAGGVGPPGGGMPPGAPIGGARGGAGGARGGGGMRGGGQEGMGGGAPFGPGGPGGGRAGGQLGGTAAPATLRTLRFIVTTTDGLRSEAYVPVNTAGPGENGWRQVGLPLQAILGFDRTNKAVKEVAFAGDATSTFYVGELRIINDATPIYGEPNVRELNLALGDEVELIGYGFGGASILKYTWDFDASDGIQVDAEGQTIKRRFRKAGEYTVTLTTSDVFGLKQPHSTTIKVLVNP